MRTFARSFAAALALTAAATAASLPAAPLTPEGMGPARIGMTVKQAEAALGYPLNVQYPNDQSCGQGGRAGVWYMFENGRLVRIDIEASTGDKPMPPPATAARILLGSTEADVKKAYAHVVVEGHPYNQHGHYMRVDTVPKKAGFIFETDGKRVTSFRAGVYPALDYSEGCS